MNRKKYFSIGIRFFSFLLLFLLLPGQARAAQKSCSITIPVQVQTAGEKIPAGENYSFTIEAVTKEAPMPSQVNVSRTDSGDLSFGPITYQTPGDYQYRVRQTTEKKDRFIYDTVAYLVTVRVVNADEDSLKAELWAAREGTESKSDSIRFQNRYDAPKSNARKHHHSSSTTEETQTVTNQILQTITSPRTGDQSMPFLWMILAVAACAGIVGVKSRFTKS